MPYYLTHQNWFDREEERRNISTLLRILTREEMTEELKNIGLELGKTKVSNNIKRPGGDAWSGGRLRVDHLNETMWLSTFHLNEEDITNNGHRSYGSCVEYKSRVEELTTDWVVGKEGIRGCDAYFPSRSLDITYKSVEEFVRIVESFQ